MSSDFPDSEASSFLSPDDDDGRINECVVDMKRALLNEKVDHMVVLSNARAKVRDRVLPCRRRPNCLRLKLKLLANFLSD
jgi:hypothetical protein